MKNYLLALVSLLFLSQALLANDLVEVNDDGTGVYKGVHLKGPEGDRSKWNMNIYHGTLLLPENAKPSGEVTNANVLDYVSKQEVVVIDMKVLTWFGVKGSQMNEVFQESFSTNFKAKVIPQNAELVAKVKKFGAEVQTTGTVPQGSHMQMIFEQGPTGDTVTFSNGNKTAIAAGSHGLAHAILSFWLGAIDHSDSSLQALKNTWIEGLNN